MVGVLGADLCQAEGKIGTVEGRSLEAGRLLETGERQVDMPVLQGIKPLAENFLHVLLHIPSSHEVSGGENIVPYFSKKSSPACNYAVFFPFRSLRGIFKTDRG